MKIYAIVAAVLLAIFLTISPASADNDLHDKDALMAEADGCAGCHRAHTAQGPKLLKEGATQDQFCFTCHDGTGAETDVVNGVLVGQPNPPGTDPTQYGNGDDGDGNPLRGGGFVYATMDTDADGVLEVGVEVTSTHSASGAVSGTMWGSGPINGGESDYGITVELKCADCHNPHGNGNYRILRGNPDGMEDEGNTTAVDVADEITKNYEVTFIAGNGTSQYYRDVSYVPDNLDDWCAQCHTRYSAGGGAGNTDSGDVVFAYRHNTASLSGGCLKCHVAHGTSATMGTYSGAVTFPDGTTQGLVPAEESRLLSNDNRKVCAPCHTNAEGTVGGHGGDGDCGACHGAEGSHATHLVANSKGMGESGDPLVSDCEDCHVGGSYPDYDESACNPCHSPGGTYNGVNDPVIGAVANWDSGVYGSPLQAGKEQWCVGCHDEVPAVIAGVSAPDVSLFWASGHGRPGADIECESCHDTSTGVHIDGAARTYSFDSAYYSPSQSGEAYAAGYRLREVGGEVPLMIPANYNITFGYNAGLMQDTAFRLCFDSGCHDSTEIFDDTPGDGIDSNFKASAPNPPRNYSYAWGSGADTNEHVSHIKNYIGPFADSDWDTGTNGAGGSDGRDTMVACSNCHNVHGVAGIDGSTNEPMVRDGSLAGRTGYGFSYVVEDTGAGGYPWVTSTGATQATSTGAIFRTNTANMCGGSMCHGNPTPPAGSSYDASGSSWGTYLEYYRPWQDYNP